MTSMLLFYIIENCYHDKVESSGHAVQGLGLWLLDCWITGLSPTEGRVVVPCVSYVLNS